MPITTLDPTAALLVIDLQKGMLGIPTVHPFDEITARAASLLRVFRERGLPVVLVNVVGASPGRTDAGAGSQTAVLPEGWMELLPELEPQPGDVLISKRAPGAFLGTTLDAELRTRGVTQVFLAGVATTGGVEATARSARDLGYHVVLVTDAMTDRDAEAHRSSVDMIFPRLGETGTTEDVLRLLEE